MNAISNVPHIKTSEEIRLSISPWNSVTSNQERILKPVCNKETSQKKMQMEKHEKVELVHVEWLQQKQTAHLLDDTTIAKERTENTAGRKCYTEIESSVQTTWWMDRKRKVLWYCSQKRKQVDIPST
jgi:hypothetical protein